MNNLPSMEKKIMKLAEIWTTLRLPTRVKANKPAFSLEKIQERHSCQLGEIDSYGNLKCYYYICGAAKESYTDTDDPFPVPNIPEKRMPTPYNQKTKNIIRK